MGESVMDFLTRMGAEDIVHSDEEDEYLAHYGIKGMRWGVRRSTSTLDSASGRTADRADHAPMSKMGVGSVVSMHDPKTGQNKAMIKKKDGSWEEIKLSSDAENLIRSHQSSQHALSDKEMRDAVARARLIEDYNKMFGPPDQQAQLRNQVEQMNLQKRYSELHGQLHPSRTAKVAALVASAGTAYISYKKLDKASDGALSRGIATALGQRPTGGKHKLTADLAKAAAKKAAKKDIAKSAAKVALKEAL